MASSSNNCVSDTAANSEPPEKSPAEPCQLSSEALIDLSENLEVHSSIYGTPRSEVSIPGTSSSASSYDTGAAYFTPHGGSSISTLHADSSSEVSTPSPRTRMDRMVQELMDTEGYIAACIEVGRTVRYDKMREDFENNGVEVPHQHQQGEKYDYAPKPPGSGRK